MDMLVRLDAPMTNRLTFKILHKMADGISHHFWPHQNVERKDIETKRDKQHFFLDASQESQVQTYRQLYLGLLSNSQHHIVMRSHWKYPLFLRHRRLHFTAWGLPYPSIGGYLFEEGDQDRIRGATLPPRSCAGKAAKMGTKVWHSDRMGVSIHGCTVP